MKNPFPAFPAWPPDYRQVFEWRQRQILQMRANPALIVGAKAYYSTRPVDFIEHWCSTYDPRNAGKSDKLTTMPFVLFQKQKDLILCLQQAIAVETSALIEKCRDMGATWDCCAFSVWLWLFLDGSSVGWGSRKEQLVDKLGDPDSIFEKMRIIIRLLPPEFLPIGFKTDEHMPFMRIVNPETGASITGEAGDNIGRGGRKLIYFKDESAHYERPEKIEAALSETTRVQVDISSVNGPGNIFHRKRKNGVVWNRLIPIDPHKTAVFIMDWRDHPEKTQEWYDRKRQKAVDDGLLHLFAQEIDRDYAASIEGVIIKPEWARACVDAHLPRMLPARTLQDGTILPERYWPGFTDEGKLFGSLDVADEGGDKNAAAARKGPILKAADHWGEGDTGQTTRRAVGIFRPFGPIEINYDSVGVGAGVKAESNRLIEEKIMPAHMQFVPWNAGLPPLYPDQHLIPNDINTPLNEDYFANIKAQAWWQLARRAERTFRAMYEGITYDPGELLSLPSTLHRLEQILTELSQAVFVLSTKTLKTIVDKNPDGTQSPNLADSIVMAFWPITIVNLYTAESLG